MNKMHYCPDCEAECRCEDGQDDSLNCIHCEDAHPDDCDCDFCDDARNAEGYDDYLINESLEYMGYDPE